MAGEDAIALRVRQFNFPIGRADPLGYVERDGTANQDKIAITSEDALGLSGRRDDVTDPARIVGLNVQGARYKPAGGGLCVRLGRCASLRFGQTGQAGERCCSGKKAQAQSSGHRDETAGPHETGNRS
jgi:hypothetical protein